MRPDIEKLGVGGHLYTDEMEPGTLAMCGNFPQALTHLSLISAAASIEQQDGTRLAGR